MYTQTGHEKYSRTVDKYKRTDSNNEFRSRHVFLLDFLREVSGDPGVDLRQRNCCREAICVLGI